MKKTNERKHFVIEQLGGHNYYYSKGLCFIKPFEKDSAIRKLNEKAFREVEKLLPFSRNWKYLYTMLPEHGSKVICIDDYDLEIDFSTFGIIKLARPKVACDSIVTGLDLPLAIFPADCTCVGFWDPRKYVKALAHSGWRGTLDKVVPKTIEKMIELGSNPNDILVVMGPSIGKKNLQIGEDCILMFKKYALENKIQEEYAISYNEERGKYNIDISFLILDQLLKAGVDIKNIIFNEYDTFSSLDEEGRYNFHSYRREKSDYRNACILV